MMRRGDLYWFEPDPVSGSEQGGRRPALIISRDAINQSSPVVVVVPLTSYRGGALYPSEVLIKAPEGGLAQDSVAMALQIWVADKARLATPIGRLSEETVAGVAQAILRVLAIRV